jgi:tetratricopeptide (TPR) repeat protein
MAQGLKMLAFALSLYLTGPACGAQVSSADEELASGISAREKGDYEAALQHMQRAVSLDPNMARAHFALGSTADDLCFSSARPHPGRPVCELAIREYKRALELNSSDGQALKNLGYMLYQLDLLDESESYYRRDFALHPGDAEALCAVAFFDLSHFTRDLAPAKVGLGGDEASFIDSPTCKGVFDGNHARIVEDLTLLRAAAGVRARNLDLMGYLSSFYFALAQIQCGNRKAYDADMSLAREWAHKLTAALARPRGNDAFRKCPPAPPPPSPF